MIFVCPKCKGKLNREEGRAVCASGHGFDRSRYGYYNLLLSSAGGVHGDNADMVAARREFLSYGYYEPLREALAEAVSTYAGEDTVLVDAGCGEGERIAEVLSAYPRTRVGAFDISKDAARRAARRLAGAEVAVAGSYHMPLADGSVDIVINTFSPLAADETRRVLRGGGHFIMAIPAEEHLFGLKSAVYDTPYKNTVESTELEGFALVGKKELKYEINLDTGAKIRSLFMMTPYAYRTSAEGRERVLSLDSLSTDAHFLILIYERRE